MEQLQEKKKEKKIPSFLHKDIQQTEVKITVDTGVLSEHPARQSVFILSNDPADPVREVMLINNR